MMTRAFKSILAPAGLSILLALSAGLLTPQAARAQDAALPTKNVSVTLNNAPVKVALDTLFKSANLNYTIDPTVTGLVSVNLRDVPFDVALRSVLRSASPPLTYSEVDGIYNVKPRASDISVMSNVAPQAQPGTSQPASQSASPTNTQLVRIPVHYLFAENLLQVLGGGQVLKGLTLYGGGQGQGQGAVGVNGGSFGGGGQSGFGGGGQSSFGGGGQSGFGGGGISFGGGSRGY